MSETRMLVVKIPCWSIAVAGIPLDRAAVSLSNGRVVEATSTATGFGVAPGLNLRKAQSLCPSLSVIENNMVQSAQKFDQIVVALGDITPRIEVLDPGFCSFMTRGPSGYFGGDERLVEEVISILKNTFVDLKLSKALRPHIGVADDLFGASLAAYFTESRLSKIIDVGETLKFVRSLPTSVLFSGVGSFSFDFGLINTFLRLGLQSLGDIGALQASDVLGRFGTSGELIHRFINGLGNFPITTRSVSSDLEKKIEFEPPLEQVEDVVSAAKSLGHQLSSDFSREGLTCLQVSIEIETEHGEKSFRYWRHEHQFMAANVGERVRWQLQNWLQSDSTLTGGIILLRILPEEVVPHTGKQLRFWGGQTDEDFRASQAFEKVQKILGQNEVTLVAEGSGRQLTEFGIRVSFTQEALLSSERSKGFFNGLSRPWPGRLPSPSPAAVFSTPKPLEVFDVGGKPVQVSGRGNVTGQPATLVGIGDKARSVINWAGPWPVEEHWWDLDKHYRQARFQFVLDDGSAHLCVVERSRWWLQATYS
ncbi:MAG: hypothetical protein ACJ05G_00905 [Actinomycetota bacterium]